jgi:hypothetical protein
MVILVPGLRADDLSRPEITTLREIVARSAVGWMNVRTARVPGLSREPAEAAYLTLGTGSRASSGSYARQITADSLVRLRIANSRLDHPVNVGLLGDMLQEASLTTQVFGAPDTDTHSDAAKLVAMNRYGLVGQDQTTRSLWSGPAWLNPDEVEAPLDDPYGLRTDVMQEATYYGQADFTVMCFGDLQRADHYAPLCTTQAAEKHRTAALSRLSDFLYEPSVASVDSSTLFLLLAPSAAESASDDDRLAPILMWGDGITRGLLTSGSTHSPGLVTNTDFLPTMGQYFGITPPKGLVGRPMTVVPLPRKTLFESWLDRILGRTQASATNGPAPEMWAEMHDRWYAQSRKQALFGGLPTIQFLLVLASLLPFLPSFPLRSARLRSLSPCLLVAMSALPLALLVLPPVSPASLIGCSTLLTAALLAAAAFAWLWPGARLQIAVGLLGALVAVVALDLIMEGLLLRQAWMSYSVMEGARYYGIGNEYVGAVFGAMMALSVVALRGERIWRWPIAAGVWLALSVIIGLPQLGANAGGFLGTAVGCGVAALVWWRGRIRGRDVLALTAAVCLLMAALLALDLARGGAEQSHIARAVTGGGSVLNIAARKAMLNGYLLFHSPWTLGLLAAAYGLWVTWCTAPPAGRADRGMWAGLAAGATALFLLNDSGVVAAAECLLVAYSGIRLLISPPTSTLTHHAVSPGPAE